MKTRKMKHKLELYTPAEIAVIKEDADHVSIHLNGVLITINREFGNRRIDENGIEWLTTGGDFTKSSAAVRISVYTNGGKWEFKDIRRVDQHGEIILRWNEKGRKPTSSGAVFTYGPIWDAMMEARAKRQSERGKAKRKANRKRYTTKEIGASKGTKRINAKDVLAKARAKKESEQ